MTPDFGYKTVAKRDFSVYVRNIAVHLSRRIISKRDG